MIRAKKYPLILLIFICAANIGLNSIEILHPEIDLIIRRTEQAKAPYIAFNHLIISYDQARNVKTAAIAFEHEQYSRLHSFVKNDFGIYFYIVPISSLPEINELHYRLVIDGLWQHDPKNPNILQNKNGIRFSSLSIKKEHFESDLYPVVMENRWVEFKAEALPGTSVYLVGSFNNWDPFSRPLMEESSGDFRTTLKLPPGEHYYYFLYDGSKILDNINPLKTYDRDRNAVNIIRVP